MTTRRMLRFATGPGVAILLAAFMALVGGAPLSGGVSADQGADRCTLKTIKGTYVYAAHGVLNDGKSVLPYAEAATWTLDGAGHARGVFSASLNGTTIANREAFTATYRLESECLFIALAPVGKEMLEFHLYTTDQGATIAYYTAGVSGTQVRR